MIEGEPNRVRKEVMLSHGFRKFTNTMMVKANLNIVVKEKLIGHSAFGLENSYLRPDDELLISSYLQAIPFLTISREQELILKNRDIEKRNHKLEKERDDVALMNLEHQRQMNTMREEIREEMKLELNLLLGRLKPEITGEAFSQV